MIPYTIEGVDFFLCVPVSSATEDLSSRALGWPAEALQKMAGARRDGLGNLGLKALDFRGDIGFRHSGLGFRAYHKALGYGLGLFLFHLWLLFSGSPPPIFAKPCSTGRLFQLTPPS